MALIKYNLEKIIEKISKNIMILCKSIIKNLNIIKFDDEEKNERENGLEELHPIFPIYKKGDGIEDQLHPIFPTDQTV